MGTVLHEDRRGHVLFLGYEAGLSLWKGMELSTCHVCTLLCTTVLQQNVRKSQWGEKAMELQWQGSQDVTKEIHGLLLLWSILLNMGGV